MLAAALCVLDPFHRCLRHRRFTTTWLTRGTCCCNDRCAAAALKTIATAQVDFRENDRDGNGKNDFWRADVAGLFSIVPGGMAPGPANAVKLIEMSLAAADDRPQRGDVSTIFQCEPGPRAGYWFRAIWHGDERDPSPTRFAACAYPDRYGESGVWTFVVDEKNTMYKKDFGDTGCFVHTFPADPLKEGWKKVD